MLSCVICHFNGAFFFFQTGDLSVVYACVTTLVNLTNSYDNEEVIPELVELAKFAKQHVPETHIKVNLLFIYLVIIYK